MADFGIKISLISLIMLVCLSSFSISREKGNPTNSDIFVGDLCKLDVSKELTPFCLELLNATNGDRLIILEEAASSVARVLRNNVTNIIALLKKLNGNISEDERRGFDPCHTFYNATDHGSARDLAEKIEKSLSNTEDYRLPEVALAYFFPSNRLCLDSGLTIVVDHATFVHNVARVLRFMVDVLLPAYPNN